MDEERTGSAAGSAIPFPESLCHACAAPIRLVRNDRGSIFLFCPVFRRYPPQPVLRCDRFVPRPEADQPAKR